MVGLNAEQQQAMLHETGPALVLAGAGSGKTRVVTLRIARLIELGVPADAILAVTFTNKAAAEMRERVQQMVGTHVHISTFHSLGARLLREQAPRCGLTHTFAIYDADDSEKLLVRCAAEFSEGKVDTKRLTSYVSSCKNKLLRPDEIKPTLEQPKGPTILSRYIEALRGCNAVDFDDLLYLTVQLLENNPDVLERYQQQWQYVLVDEYQDTNTSQFRMMQLLAAPRNNLFVVGDPDQSIYSWRGAEITNIMRFEEHFPGASVIRLEENYRSTTTILEAANNVIRNNGQRYAKSLWSSLGEGQPIALYEAYSERNEAEYVTREIRALHRQGMPLSDMVIFYRTNFQSRSFEDLLLLNKIPYTIIGGLSFYARKEIKDILSYLRLIENPRDEISLLRVINLPKRGIGETLLAHMREFADAHQMPLLHAIATLLYDPSLDLPFAINVKQRAGLQAFLSLLEGLKAFGASSSVSDLISEVVERTDYRKVLLEDGETYEERLANVAELAAKAAEWEEGRQNPTLPMFLEELTLATSEEHKGQQECDRLSLMTLHTAKGLEFRAAFIVGLEEDLFPHINSKGEQNKLEEERRLFYVGITRARERLSLSYATSRTMWGSYRSTYQSRFLREIPGRLITRIKS